MKLWLGDLNGLAVAVRDEGGCSRSDLRVVPPEIVSVLVEGELPQAATTHVKKNSSTIRLTGRTCSANLPYLFARNACT